MWLKPSVPYFPIRTWYFLKLFCTSSLITHTRRMKNPLSGTGKRMRIDPKTKLVNPCKTLDQLLLGKQNLGFAGRYRGTYQISLNNVAIALRQAIQLFPGLDTLGDDL